MKSFEQVHVRILSTDRIRPGYRIEIAAAGRRNRVVEKREGLVYNLQDLIVASEPMIPSKPQQNERMCIGVAYAACNAAVRCKRVDPARFSVAPVEGAKHVVDAIVRQPTRPRIPAEQTRMAINIELTALHHQSLGDIEDRFPLQVQPFVKSSARAVEADSSPKWQSLVLDPRVQCWQSLLQKRKIAHWCFMSRDATH